MCQLWLTADPSTIVCVFTVSFRNVQDRHETKWGATNNSLPQSIGHPAGDQVQQSGNLQDKCTSLQVDSGWHPVMREMSKVNYQLHA